MKSLQAGAEHRTVDLAQQPARDVNDPARIDAEEVAVERQVVDRAQRHPVHDRGHSLGLGVGNDVRGLHQLPLAERADRAAMAVGPHHVELEALLM